MTTNTNKTDEERVKEFCRIFARYFQKNREEFRKSTEELRHVPLVRLRLLINDLQNDI